MIFPNSSSFTPIATLHLPTPHILHPDACNPAMDLVVLLAPFDSASSVPTTTTKVSNSAVTKGKGKAETSGSRIKVALWRMSGSKVWEVELEGNVEGLAWSLDGEKAVSRKATVDRIVGLHLSLLQVNYPFLPSTFLQPGERWQAKTATLSHLSVHNGAVVRSIPCPQAVDNLSARDRADLQSGSRWWRMEWRRSGTDWGQTRVSAIQRIDTPLND